MSIISLSTDHSTSRQYTTAVVATQNVENSQEHDILARLDFSPILSQVDLLVDQRGSQMLDRRIMDRSVDTAQSACQ